MQLRSTSPLFAASAALALALALPGCPKETPDPAGNFDRNALLSSIATNAGLAPLHTFRTAADALVTATAALASARNAGQDATAATTAARDAWKTAVLAWEETEPLQVGPAGAPTRTTGGLNLRDSILSWPNESFCKVDQALVKNEFGTDGWFEHQLVDVTGLSVIEYVLFREDAGNACGAQAAINTQGTWAALGESGIATRRAAYAAAASKAVAAVTAQLVTAWEGPAGYAAQLASAGKSGSPFTTARLAIDEVFAAMFYADLAMKTAKLGDPAGITTKCTTTTCPELLESQWAHVSKEQLVANLRGLQRTFLGGDPAEKATNTGFDDYLVASGAQDLADRMVTALADSITAVEAIDGTLDAALTADADGVLAAHTALKTFTDLMKSQFVTVLNLSVPQEGAADND